MGHLGLLVAGAMALSACGNGTATDAPTSDPPATDGTESEAPASAGEEQLRVALLLPGETTDRGFNATGEMAADLIEEEYGADVAFTESVNPANQADVYRQYANQGYDLIIGWGGQFTDGAVEVAEEFADTYFLVVSSGASNGSNLASYDTAIEDWQFLAGYLMARLSETGVVGQVSGQCFPSTAANQNGTRDGALYANPDIEWLATYTGDFEDPTAAQQAAQAMIDEGADVLHTNLNQAVFGVVQAAQDADGVLVVTEWLDNSDTAPDVIVSTLNKSYARFVLNKVEELVNGEWQGVNERFPLPDDWGPGVFDTDLLPDDLYEEVIEVQEQVASGEIEVERDETCPGQ
jgi:basic membrane lipoprotein Med (substrate-binding protein (PBP1-ABC) superfamily)